MMRMRGRWLVAVGVLVALAAVVVVVSRRGGPDLPTVPAPLRDELAVRTVAALEHDPAFRSQMSGDAADRAVCVADVFGVAPERAATAAEVSTVYARIACSWLRERDLAAGPAVDPTGLSGLSMPIAVRCGPPITYEVPGDGAAYTDSIRRIFPDRLERAALAPAGQALADALRRRVRQVAVSAAPSRELPRPFASCSS
jgi:hypothetical protein